MRRFREAATESDGFYNTSGFVDDTRAFTSIPARQDLSRRVDGLPRPAVLEHRLGLDEAVETAVDLAYNLPPESYARAWVIGTGEALLNAWNREQCANWCQVVVGN